jgi:hypothetical protein
VTFIDCAIGYGKKSLAVERCKSKCPLGSKNDSNATENSCNATSLEQCHEGYSGLLCMDCEHDYVRIGANCKPCEGVGARKGLLSGAFGGVIGINGIFFFVFVVLFLVTRDEDQNEDVLDDADPNDPTKIRGLKKNVASRSQDAMSRFAGDQIMIARLSNGTAAGSGGIAKSDVGLLLDRVKVIWGWMQVFSAMTITYDAVPWPEGFKAFSMNIGLAVNLDFMGVLDVASCNYALPFLDKFILHMFTPFVITAFVCLARIPAHFLRKRRRRAQTELMYKITVTIVLIMYPVSRCWGLWCGCHSRYSTNAVQ